jgi:protein arginine N-methyltransferase 3
MSASAVNTPAREDIPDSVSDSSDTSNEEGWEDVEPDEESQPVVGLFSEQVFPDARSMLKECKEKYNFDLLKIQKDLGMRRLLSWETVHERNPKLTFFPF